MKRVHIAAALALLLASALSLPGQEVVVKEWYPPVPGRSVDHKGLVLNPTPQTMDVDWGGTLPVGAGLDIPGKLASTHPFPLLPSSRGGVKFTFKSTDGLGGPVGGGYRLTVNGKGIKLESSDDEGTFYGIQTILQLLEDAKGLGGKIPYLCITDFPTLPMRGVVEGFYGEPWSHEVRLSLLDFMGRHKMNTYVYGPKDDPYHRTPSWREPYPEDKARQIAQLAQRSRANHIRFIWAIHPGGDIKWNEEDYGNILRKFSQMYELGVRDFAIFFDDISGEGTNPRNQAAWLNRLKDDFVKKGLDIGELILCPTDYSQAWANPSPEGSLAIYGRELDPKYRIFWTGERVMSDILAPTLRFVDERIGRPALFWWNYPVTDYIRNKVLQGPCYGFDTTLTAEDLCGVTSNPMEHGEASKLAIYSVADYTWNVKGYNPMDSWERGLAELCPEDPEAYRLFAMNSTDATEDFRKAESWELGTEKFNPGKFSSYQYESLHSQFAALETVPWRMEKACPEALLRELRPWITELGKLATRCRKAMELALMKPTVDEETFRRMYDENVMSEEDREDYKAHTLGTVKLQPFYERLMKELDPGGKKAEDKPGE